LKNSILATVIVAATSWSATPVQFTSGQPAKASEVNQNFAYMDSAISKKANRTSLDSLGALLKAKPDTSTVNTSILNALVPVNASLRGKVDTGNLKASLSAINTKLALTADTSWVGKKVSDTAAALRKLIGSGTEGTAPKYPTEYIVQGPEDFNHTNNSPWYGLGLSNLTSGQNFLVQLGGYYGLNILSGGGYPIYVRSANHEIVNFGWNQTVFTVSDAKILTLDKGLASVTGNLSVSGVIHASTGTIAVPDYVFEPGYKLAPLAAVEAFTKENKHLPEVPAASELEKGGIDLAQMNLTLLKKIEELTLHAIAQEKRLESQDRSIAEMKSALESLSTR